LDAALASLIDTITRLQDFFIVAAVTIPVFWLSRHILKREIYRAKTLMSSIVSVAFALINGLMLPVVAWYGTVPVSRFLDSIGAPVIPESYWDAWPLAIVVIIGLVTHDFVEYWVHRILHTKWLWPIHAIHHSDPDVNGFTTFRVHILQLLFTIVSFTLTLSWLGITAEAAAIGGLIVTVLNAYVHMDLDWGHGPLRYVIASPRFHRWHHADTPELYGKNIANMFPFFDIMFGTYHVPGNCREPMGAVGVPENDMLKLMLYPFVEPVRMFKVEVAMRKAKQLQETRLAKASATPAE
jgi:sterol desaturase/sphingolipid hydroxylase (fatty acid hydroxylase superfamily)